MPHLLASLSLSLLLFLSAEIKKTNQIDCMFYMPNNFFPLSLSPSMPLLSSFRFRALANICFGMLIASRFTLFGLVNGSINHNKIQTDWEDEWIKNYVLCVCVMETRKNAPFMPMMQTVIDIGTHTHA